MELGASKHDNIKTEGQMKKIDETLLLFNLPETPQAVDPNTLQFMHRRHIMCSPICVTVIAVSCLLVSVMCICFMAITFTSLRGMEARIEQRLEERLSVKIEERILSIIEEKFGLDPSELRQALHPLVETGPDDGQVQLTRKKKSNPRRQPGVFVHLIGRQSNHIYDENNNFVWDKQPDVRIPSQLELVRDGMTGAYAKVRIKAGGAYLIYSQIAVHGQQSSFQSFPNDCAHQTVLTKTTLHDKILLRSLLTQYKLGAAYHTNVYGQNLHAIDTKLQMGVFYLLENEEIRVNYSTSCGNFNYTMRPEHSYFGVAKIG